ncbi:MAG: stalk domain-containing protein [Eubacteriales bacterium]|jgi:transglutaminase-like putative cysteine protease
MERKHKWLKLLAVLAAGALAVAVPLHISALEEAAYDRLVSEISAQMGLQEENFALRYDGVLLERDKLAQAVEEAISTNVGNLFHVAGYSYVQQGKSVEFTVSYSNLNAYPISFAPSEKEIAHILERTLSQRAEGINIFVRPQSLLTVDEMKQQAQTCYNYVYQNAGDDYSKYSLKSIHFGITTVTSVPEGYFLTYSLVYNETPAQTAEVDAFVEQLLSELQLDGLSQRQRVERLNDAVEAHVSYLDTGSDRDYTAYGAVHDGTAVCQGYSLLMDRLMKEAGIPCRIVTGQARDPYTGSQGAHMWNIVEIDGEWLHVDTTWNDAYGQSNPYLLVSDSQIARDHMFDTEIYSEIRLETGLEELKKQGQEQILLEIGSPTMWVGGQAEPVDPGRETAPVVLEDRTLLPIRCIVERLGGQVEWQEESGQIDIRYRDYQMTLWQDQARAVVNGMLLRMDVPLTTLDGRVLVPVRFLAEMLGMGVEWQPQTRQVCILPH